jgi:hypothetical protein
MMEGIDGERRGAESERRPAAFLESHRVRARVAGRARIVCERFGPLRREVLVQRAAERHVDELDPATDAQDGELALARGGEDGELEEVALAARRREVGRRCRSIPGRMDVLAAGEQQTVQAVERACGEGGLAGARITGTPPAARTDRT